MQTDRPLPGIAMMLLFCFLAPLADSMAKLIGDKLAVLSLVGLRFAAQTLILLPIVWATNRRLRLAPKTIPLHFLRTMLHIMGIALMFLALRYLPLAEAIAIAYVMPFILLMMAHLFLGEEIGWRRTVACIVGFAGTLLVVQPSFASVGAPALYPLAVAFIFAAFMLVTRQLAKVSDPIELQATNGVITTGILLPVIVAGAIFADTPRFPDLSDTSLLIQMAALGVLGTLSHLAMTWALRFAPSATLAPVQYLEIPFAAGIGLMIFGDFPNGLALAGIVITMAAGVYIVVRERILSRQPSAT